MAGLLFSSANFYFIDLLHIPSTASSRSPRNFDSHAPPRRSPRLSRGSTPPMQHCPTRPLAPNPARNPARNPMSRRRMSISSCPTRSPPGRSQTAHGPEPDSRPRVGPWGQWGPLIHPAPQLDAQSRDSAYPYRANAPTSVPPLPQSVSSGELT